MRKLAPILLMLAVGVVVAAETGPPKPLDRNDTPVFDVRVSVRPVADDEYLFLPRPKPNSFRCSVLVFQEAGGKRGWSTEDIVIGPGESSTSNSALNGLSLYFAARINESGEVAETVVSVTRAGKVLNRQRTTVALRPGNIGRRYRPTS
jgi:hypothetical protein